MWEEDPVGDWKIEIINDGRVPVELKSWSISFYGTKDHPQPISQSALAPEAPVGQSASEEDLNQLPKVPEQKTADVTKTHHGGKDLKTNVVANNEAIVQTPIRIDHCLDNGSNANWCSVCEAGFLMLNGRCVDACPAEGYYQGQENHQQSCLQCYYSCKTCSGPNDYQVIIIQSFN